MDVGLDGNDAPEQVDGIRWEWFTAINARAYTYAGREFFNDHYGIGIVDALANPQQPSQEIVQRIRASFAGSRFNPEAITVRQNGGSLVIQIDPLRFE